MNRCCAADAECWRQMERFGNEATADGALEAAALLHATHLSGAAPRVVLPPDCLAAIESRLLEGRVSPTLFADAAGAILSRMLDAIPIAWKLATMAKDRSANNAAWLSFGDIPRVCAFI